MVNIAVVRAMVYFYITVFPRQPSREHCFKEPTADLDVTKPIGNLCAGVLVSRIFIMLMVHCHRLPELFQ